jgi:Iap family predicted aminopeptidase
MTIKELQEIIALNIDAAEAGSLQAQGQVVEAQAEIERLEREAEEARRDEWCEAAGIPSIDDFPPLSAEDLAAIERDEAEVARRVAEAREREELTDFSCLTDEEMAGDW